MTSSIARFVLNEEQCIVDTLNRLPSSSTCDCGCCGERPLSEPRQQIYLRRCVLKAQLPRLCGAVECLAEAEAHALNEVIYWTVYASKLDWTIGGGKQAAYNGPLARRMAKPDNGISLLIEQVKILLCDVYGDCDPVILAIVIKSVREIILQWDHVRENERSLKFFGRFAMNPAYVA